MKKIIYIDDNPIELALFQMQMLKQDIFCQVFLNTASLEAYLETPIKYDLLICDYNGTTIFDLEEELKQVKIPVILTSGNHVDTELRFIPKDKLADCIPCIVKGLNCE